MNPSITVVIPSYDLQPILGPRGLPPELCALIDKWVIEFYKDNINNQLGALPCMRYGFSIVRNPRLAETQRVCNPSLPGTAVWYDAVLSPTYEIGYHLHQLIGRHSKSLSGQNLVDRIEYNMTMYINRVSEIMDVDSPPVDFRAAFDERSLSNIRELMEQIRENGKLTGIDPFAGFPLPHGLM
jgi:hypothetical protein